jgi:hypothetical protein
MSATAASGSSAARSTHEIRRSGRSLPRKSNRNREPHRVRLIPKRFASALSGSNGI